VRTREELQITVNGTTYSRQVSPRTTLADFLREDLDLTATHLGCEHGVCGACTVFIDGRTARSCTVLALQAHNAQITTAEGLADGDVLTPVQQGFWARHGMQCGFCTPGFLMTVTELLRDHPEPTDAQIEEALGGNLCRCTGYTKIIEAVHEAVSISRAQRNGHLDSGSGANQPDRQEAT
jgi:aerobic-type carbon monoxide dehydrogenase small subunit (CoxS/CutS family)